jgi:endonuclease YncB( thermonuclease family)
MRRRGRFRVVRGGRRDPPQFWPDARGRSKWSRYYGLWSFAVLAGLLVGVALAMVDRDQSLSGTQPQSFLDSAAARVSFGYCHTGGGTNCVVDGDTIWFHGQNIRIADIDAPETHEPRCGAELELGDRATRRLHQLVNSGAVSLSSINRDEDRYGRKLRIVKVDGVSVGDTLVSDGLARWYAGGRRSWCG